MFRCVLVELVSLGGGHALSGRLARGLVWAAVIVAMIPLWLWSPWIPWITVVVRVASLVDAGRQGRRGPVGGRWHWLAALGFVVVSFAVCTGSRASFVAERADVGMSPTIEPGDVVLVDRISLAWAPPARGDVVVYGNGRANIGRVVALANEEIEVRGGVVHVNREPVPQLPAGEVETWGYRFHGKVPAFVEERGGRRHRVVVDVRATSGDVDYPRWPDGTYRCDVDPPTPPALPPPPRRKEPTRCVVPAGSLFVVGDDRGDDGDSRRLGPVPIESIEGRVVGIVKSGHGGWFSRVGAIE